MFLTSAPVPGSLRPVNWLGSSYGLTPSALENGQLRCCSWPSAYPGEFFRRKN